jgi:hypothetical protein
MGGPHPACREDWAHPAVVRSRAHRRSFGPTRPLHRGSIGLDVISVVASHHAQRLFGAHRWLRHHPKQDLSHDLTESTPPGVRSSGAIWVRPGGAPTTTGVPAPSGPASQASTVGSVRLAGPGLHSRCLFTAVVDRTDEDAGHQGHQRCLVGESSEARCPWGEQCCNPLICAGGDGTRRNQGRRRRSVRVRPGHRHQRLVRSAPPADARGSQLQLSVTQQQAVAGIGRRGGTKHRARRLSSSSSPECGRPRTC